MLRWKGQESKLKALHSPQILISPTAKAYCRKTSGDASECFNSTLFYTLSGLCAPRSSLFVHWSNTEQTEGHAWKKNKKKNPRKVCEPSDDWWCEARPRGDTGTQGEGERVWLEVSSRLVFGLSSRLTEMQPAFVWLKQWAVLAWVTTCRSIHPSVPAKRTNKAQIIKDRINFTPVRPS